MSTHYLDNDSSQSKNEEVRTICSRIVMLNPFTCELNSNLKGRFWFSSFCYREDKKLIFEILPWVILKNRENSLLNYDQTYKVTKTAVFEGKNSSRCTVALESVSKACLGTTNLCIKCAWAVHEVCNIFLFVCVKRA